MRGHDLADLTTLLYGLALFPQSSWLFVRVFGPYATRLDIEILPRFDPRLLRAAAAVVHDSDDELPLRAEEST